MILNLCFDSLFDIDNLFAIATLIWIKSNTLQEAVDNIWVKPVTQITI
jgi:hypothetical protein